MEQFAVAGYSGSGCLMCTIDGGTGDIWQTDYFGNRQQVIGKTSSTFAELETTTQEYYDRLVELGEIVPPKSQEQMMGEMQAAMTDMAEVIKSLTAQVKELSNSGSQSDHGGAGANVPERRPARRGGAGD